MQLVICFVSQVIKFCMTCHFQLELCIFIVNIIQIIALLPSICKNLPRQRFQLWCLKIQNFFPWSILKWHFVHKFWETFWVHFQGFRWKCLPQSVYKKTEKDQRHDCLQSLLQYNVIEKYISAISLSRGYYMAVFALLTHGIFLILTEKLVFPSSHVTILFIIY